MPFERSPEPYSDRLPSFVELMQDELDSRRFDMRSAQALEKVVSQTDDQKLANWLFIHPPEPLSDSKSAVWSWFKLMAVLESQAEGYSAKQLARRLGLEHRLPSLSWLLDRLADRGDLRRSAKGTSRFHAKPMRKVLAPLMRQFPQRLPEVERDAFELAVLAYQESPSADGWRQVTEALAALLKAIPEWPDTIAEAAGSDPGEWLRLLAGLEPPAYILEDADPLVDGLKAEIERLVAENDALNRRLSETLASADERLVRIEHLEERLSELEAWCESPSPALETDTLTDFLAGRGRGELPEDLPDTEVGRVRALVQATRANRKAMLAIAATLGDVYRNPTAHQRLTTLSFKDHPFDSLWRARVGNYRIVYGLLHNRVQPIVIGSRGEVYEQAVHVLRNRHLG